MKCISWNLNSINARLERLLALLDRHSPDIVCLQETKSLDEKFPIEEITAKGYQAYTHGQKTYNGVAILTRSTATNIIKGIPEFEDEDARAISATVNGVTVTNVYVPNGRALDDPHYEYKLKFLEALKEAQTAISSPRILCGDFNIAPTDLDVHDPAVWKDVVHVSDRERKTLAELVESGNWQDTVRLSQPDTAVFSWWDYRSLGFPLNKGLRIDFVYVSEDLWKKQGKGWVDRDERKGKKPSDHAPVIFECSP